jgi:hypothetical protein
MAAIRSAARRREQIRTEIVTPTGFDAAMVERLGKTDPNVCAPSVEAHFGEGPRRIARSLDIGIAGQRGVLVAQGEKFRNHKRSRHLDHYEGELR